MNTANLAFLDRRTITTRWRNAWCGLLLSLLWIVFLYRDTGIAMVQIWSRSDTFAHGFLVLPIVLWLVWRKRRYLAVLAPAPMLGALPFVALAGTVWLMGELAAINSVTQLAFVTLLDLSVLLVLGPSIARVILFPLGFLFFAVPIGEFLLPQLMQWTADFTVLALRLSGVPVYREGLSFVIPSGRWSVVEACSGVRYLIASVTVGALYAYLSYQSARRRILFVVVSLLVPVLANWMRAYMIVMLGHLSNNKVATGVDHLVYGWIFFGFVILTVFVFGSRWSESTPVVGVNALGQGARDESLRTDGVWVATACLAFLVVLPPLGLMAVNRTPVAEPLQIMAPPVLTPGWSMALQDGLHFKPAYRNPSTHLNAIYTSEKGDVGLFLALYPTQSRSQKLVSSENVLVASSDPQWVPIASGRRLVTLGAAQVPVRVSELRGLNLRGPVGTGSLLAWQIYWVNGTLTDSDYMATAYGAMDRLMGRGHHSAVMVVYTAKGNSGEGDAALAAFLADNYASINKLLLEYRHNQ